MTTFLRLRDGEIDDVIAQAGLGRIRRDSVVVRACLELRDARAVISAAEEALGADLADVAANLQAGTYAYAPRGRRGADQRRPSTPLHGPAIPSTPGERWWEKFTRKEPT